MEIIEKFVPDIPNPYGYIYITTNLKNGMRYVGKHKGKNFDTNYIGSGVLLKNEIQSEGLDNFKCTPIEWVSTSEELTQRESYWIKSLNAVESAKWYNLAGGSLDEGKPNSVKHKKIEVEGIQYKTNPKFGNKEPAFVMNVSDKTFDPRKFFISQWLIIMGIPRKRSKLVFWIMDNIDSNNKLSYTQEEIARKAEVSLKTVYITLSLLQEHNVLIKERNGRYRINPNFIFKGSHQQRMNIWIQYSQLEKDENPN